MAKRIKSNKVLKEDMLTKPDPPWNQLPATIVLNMYQYLGDADRVAMAKSCKHWSEVFKDPTLWRKRIIHFDSRKTIGDGQEGTFHKSETALPLSSGKFAVRFVQSFHKCLQELDISVYLSNRMQKEFAEDFMRFAESLDSAKLTKVKISFSKKDDFSDRQHLFIKPIKRLLVNQRGLKEFIIVSSEFIILRGAQLLKLLAENSGTTIQYLSLTHFFWHIEDKSRVDKRILKGMMKFQNLCRVDLDYAILSDDLVKVWARGAPALAYIKVLARHEVEHSTSSEVWEDLIATHPNVLVEFRALHFFYIGQMFQILSPAMPLNKLIFELHGGETREFTLTSLLFHLNHYKNTIKHLFVKICGDCEDLDTAAVQNILSPCTHLLPLTCKSVGNPSIERKMWVLSQQGF